ncbi:MAG: 6-bladed beta-propeller [Acidobacteriota bacterium]|nr:6-bladed beta-propeller [Acidobacteriota bacterium]
MSGYVKGGMIAFCIAGLFGCHGSDPIMRSFENGTEIIENPVRSPMDASPILTPYMEISQQRADLVQYGMRSMGEFVVDDEGNIYVVGYKNERDHFYKLDASGEFVLSFGASGQGPGELEMPLRPTVYKTRIYVTVRKNKLVVYGTDGKFIEERRLPFGVDTAEPLPEGRFLLYGFDSSAQPEPDNSHYALFITDSDFNEIKRLDTNKWYFGGDKYPPFFMWSITKDRIFVVNEERNYEIRVFDFSGNLVQKIRKAFLPQEADSVVREGILGPQHSDPSLHKGYIPSPLPCMKFFIADEEGRLLVMTYERGRGAKSFIYDVFDSNGDLIGHMDLDLEWAGRYFGPQIFVMKNGLFYRYDTDDEGYNILKIDKIRWPGDGPPSPSSS